jgi:hypothetical protein
MIRPCKCYDRDCRWYHGIRQPTGEEAGGEFHYCIAFPYGIPLDIAYGDDLHEEVKEDQIGDYVYAKK